MFRQGLHPRVRHLEAAAQVHQLEVVELAHHRDDRGVRRLFWEDQNRLAGVHSLLGALGDLQQARHHLELKETGHVANGDVREAVEAKRSRCGGGCSGGSSSGSNRCRGQRRFKRLLGSDTARIHHGVFKRLLESDTARIHHGVLPSSLY